MITQFTFIAALFAIASGATAAPDTASSVLQSLFSPEVQSSALKGYLRGGMGKAIFILHVGVSLIRILV